MRPEGTPPGPCPPLPAQGGTGCILKTPVSMTGAMVSVLRSYFGSVHRACIEKATFVWNEKVESSQIYINDEFNWDLRNVGVRPALIVSLEDFAISNKADTIGKNGTSGYDNLSGGTNISSIEESAFTIQCISKQKLEAWSLAWEVKTLIQSYSAEICKAYRFNTLSVAGIRKPTPIKEDASYLVSSVGISFRTVNTFRVYKEGLPATSFDLQLEPS